MNKAGIDREALNISILLRVTVTMKNPGSLFLLRGLEHR